MEAWLELPCAETRSHIQELPLIAWVTIGLLAKDTFALQVPGCALCRPHRLSSRR